MLHIEQAAVHRVAACGHIVDVDIAIAAGLKLFGVHEKLLIQLLVELVENQTALGRNQRGVRIGVLAVADVHDGLALFVDAVQHADEILLVVAVIAVAFRNLGAHGLESGLDDVVHLPDLNICHGVVTDITLDMIADRFQLVVGKRIKHAVRAFIDGNHNFLDVERLSGMVFLDDADHRRHSFFVYFVAVTIITHYILRG